MPRSVVSGVQQLAPGSPNCSRSNRFTSAQLLIRILGSSFDNFGELIDGPVTGSASNTIRSAVPFFGAAGALPAASPASVATPPGTAVAGRKRSTRAGTPAAD